jgi:excisionase family DNA binding protein
MEARTDEYLLTREQATRRYNISLRTLVELYRRDPEFPVLRVGKKVLIHREQADEYFTRNIREVIATE